MIKNSKYETLFYNQQEDYYICPMGQKMVPLKQAQRSTGTGYEYEETIYKAQNCNNCPLRGACHKQKGNRQIEINKRLMGHKQIRENLTAQEGIKLRGRRNSEVEQTFGQLKWNKKFNRFLLKSIDVFCAFLDLLAGAYPESKKKKYRMVKTSNAQKVNFYRIHAIRKYNKKAAHEIFIWN